MGSVIKFGNNSEVIKLANKVDSGQKLTDSEAAILKKFQAQGIPIPRTIGYAAGLIVAQMPTFMAEFGMTGGVQSGVAKMATNVLGASKVAQVASFIIGATAQGEINVPALASKTSEYLIPNYDTLRDPITKEIEGELGGVNSFNEALMKAIGTQAVDYITEYAGIVFDKVPEALMKSFLGK